MTLLPERSTCLAYIRAVSSAAGFSMEHRSVDRDGIDASLHAKGLLAQDSVLLSPQIDVQAKASKNVERHDGWVSYDLEVKNYRLLTGNYPSPRFLIVLELPATEAEWLSWDPEGLLMRRCAWWLSLRGAPSTPNLSTQRVWIPETQQFSPQAARELLLGASRQELVPFVQREET